MLSAEIICYMYMLTSRAYFHIQTNIDILTLKVPIMTAIDDKFCDIFPNFRKKNEVWYFMRIVCGQTILMKYYALFVIFEKAANFEIVVCCKL